MFHYLDMVAGEAGCPWGLEPVPELGPSGRRLCRSPHSPRGTPRLRKAGPPGAPFPLGGLPLMPAPAFVGIDVSKPRLDVHVRPAGTAFAVANDPAGIADLVARLG